MTDEMEEIERFAKSTLGGMPEVIKLLGHHNVELAKEQFRENNEMYLGRKYVQKKTLALMAMSVSLSNGQESSAMIHFKLAQNFGAEMLEILDSIKVAKMVYHFSIPVAEVSVLFPVMNLVRNSASSISFSVPPFIKNCDRYTFAHSGYLIETASANAIRKTSFWLIINGESNSDFSFRCSSKSPNEIEASDTRSSGRDSMCDSDWILASIFFISTSSDAFTFLFCTTGSMDYTWARYKG